MIKLVSRIYLVDELEDPEHLPRTAGVLDRHGQHGGVLEVRALVY